MDKKKFFETTEVEKNKKQEEVGNNNKAKGNMYLSELKIKGYKIFDGEFTVKLNSGLTVLIGENGCGKSAIIDSIRLLLNEDEFGRIGISESHFHRPIGKPASEGGSDAIEVKGTFSSLSESQQIAYLPWLDATDNTKAYLNKKIDNKPNLRGRFDHTTWGGESLTGIFEWELVNAISCIYLPPLRDAESKLEAYRGSRLSRLFRKDKPKKGEPKHELELAVEDFNNKLLGKKVISDVNDSIKKYLIESLGNKLGQDAIIQFSEVGFDRIVERLRLLFYPKGYSKRITLIGKSISLFAYDGAGQHQHQFCPDSYSPIEWRNQLSDLLKKASDISNNVFPLTDLTWSQWTVNLKNFLQNYWSNFRSVKNNWDSVKSKIKAPNGSASKQVLVKINVAQNTYSEKIRMTTFHDVKGETLDAVLIVSSKDKKSNGGHFEQWLSESADEKEYVRFAYVASSRPKHLLIWAIPKINNNQLISKIKDLGFETE